jgi:hypothetical protein
MIKGAKAVEFEDQRLMSLSRPVAVIGEVKIVLRKVRLRCEILDIARTKIFRGKEPFGRFEVGRAQQKAWLMGGRLGPGGPEGDQMVDGGTSTRTPDRPAARSRALAIAPCRFSYLCWNLTALN